LGRDLEGNASYRQPGDILDEVVHRAMERKPKSRFSSMQELMDALEAIIAGPRKVSFEEYEKHFGLDQCRLPAAQIDTSFEPPRPVGESTHPTKALRNIMLGLFCLAALATVLFLLLRGVWGS